MRFATLVLVAAVTLCTVGCAASGQLYDSPSALDPGASEIVVYRPERFARGGVTYLVHLDGKEVAKLQNAGYATISTAPGRHEVEIHASAFQRFKPMKVVAEVRAGERMFLRFEPFVSGPVSATPYAFAIPVGYTLVQVLEADALIELRALRRSEQD